VADLDDVKVTERWYYAYIGDVFCTDIEGWATPLGSG
jgi:hypothetical protein